MSSLRRIPQAWEDMETGSDKRGFAVDHLMSYMGAFSPRGDSI